MIPDSVQISLSISVSFYSKYCLLFARIKSLTAQELRRPTFRYMRHWQLNSLDYFRDTTEQNAQMGVGSKCFPLCPEIRFNLHFPYFVLAGHRLGIFFPPFTPRFPIETFAGDRLGEFFDR